MSIPGSPIAHNSKRAVDLRLGGCSSTELGRHFGTPLIVLDEAQLRGSMRRFRAAFDRPGWPCDVLYAGKALLLKALARIAHEEGLALDVCSLGELRTALAAGVPADRCMLHGCYKTAGELDEAVARRVGYVVIDHAAEIAELARRASATATGASGSVDVKSTAPVSVLVRVNPGIAAHTHGRIRTAAPDSKFGFAIADGQALAAVAAVRRQPSLRLAGIHCHIGSQIRDLETYALEVEELVTFAAAAKRELEVTFDAINIGGGLGIAEGEALAPTPEAWAATVFGVLEQRLESTSLPRPKLMIEPGRALIGPAGTTLYRIGVRKRLPDGKTALIADGGMSDNPRPALYDARYPVTLASRPDAAADGTYTIFGRHCETDKLFSDVALPDPQPGDLLAVRNTGAYTYSMASNYNRFSRPAVVLVNEGSARLIARREPVEHILELDTDVEPVVIGAPS